MAGESFGLRPGYFPSSGDCPDCDADTELVANPEHPGIWHLNIRHDDTCPSYRAMKDRRPNHG